MLKLFLSLMQMSSSLENTIRTTNVSLNEFAQILEGLPFLEFKVIDGPGILLLGRWHKNTEYYEKEK